MNLAQKTFSSCLLGGLAFFAASKGEAQVAAAGNNARGQFSQSMPFNGGVPLLSAFNFDYGFGSDHHFGAMTVLPTNNNSVTVGYYDKNFDDSYSWRVAFHTVSNPAIIQNTISGSCRYECKTPLQVPAGFIFVLKGFRIGFPGGTDHQIKTIGVQQGGNELNVWLADKNGDDQFSYEVRYALVPASMIAESGTLRGTGVSMAEGAVMTGRTVIRGFMMHFASSDHHISQIGVIPMTNKIRVNYRDKNGDDTFSWRVLWSRLR